MQTSGAKDESSRSGTLTFNGTHASERGAVARKVEWGPALREFENFVGSRFTPACNTTFDVDAPGQLGSRLTRDPAGTRPGPGRRRPGAAAPRLTPRPADRPARSRMRVWPRFIRVSSVRRGERGGRGRVRPSVLPPPRAPRGAAGCCFVELRIRRTKDEVGASTVRRRGRSPGARPVKPAVGWYMPFGFRSGQNRATCGSWTVC